MKVANQILARKITNELMTNYEGKEAARLQLRGKNEEDYGGNCRDSVYKRIIEILEAK